MGNWSIDRLGKVLSLLAAEPSVQIASFPKGVRAAEEIALELDYVLEALRSHGHVIPSTILSELESINRALGDMSGEEHSEQWTDHALGVDESWIQIRSKAKALADEYGFHYDLPVNLNENEYIIP